MSQFHFQKSKSRPFYNYLLILGSMQFKKAIISLSLFFAYSIGFSHGLIPHCHHSDSSTPSETEHIAEHHFHDGHHHNNHSSEHFHIAHQKHYDEGLFDFIVCLLSESGHPYSHTAYLPLAQNYRYESPVSWPGPLKFTALGTTGYFPLGNNTALNANHPIIKHLLSLQLISTAPHRGPPVFTC